MFIIGGTASHSTAQDIAKQLKQSVTKTTIKRFPDKEAYVRIEDDPTEEHVVLVQTTYPDENILELFLLQDAITRAGANKITVVIPYYGYGRQDQLFKQGEVISAQTIAKHIQMQADEVILVDPHKKHILDFFDIPAKSCTAIPEISSYFKKKEIIDLVLAPDKGALNAAKQAAKLIGCPCDFLEKTRIDGTTVEMKTKNLEVKNQNVAIIDDIISTGGTMAQAIQQLKQQGARHVYAACTHGLFTNNAVEKLQKAGVDDIIATDTIQNQFSKVKIAPAIAQILASQ
jgi:ribose-phosphate pyrophosphokinase